MATDKDLGPALIEREQYIALALELLLDTKSYRQLSNADALHFVDATKQTITEWVTTHTHTH
jgi:transposase-like protein